MIHTYNITGMTCGGCKASVIKHLSALDHITNVEVNLEAQEAKITMSSHVATKTLQQALQEKYTLSEKKDKYVGNANGRRKKQNTTIKTITTNHLLYSNRKCIIAL